MSAPPSIKSKSLDQIFGGTCEFIAGVATLDQLPNFRNTEIAFAGRSNVGKSSLINAILKRDIAHTSRTPGRTQQLNFFDVGGYFTLVDMPGYGYAQVSKATKALWEDLISTYLRGRPNLKMVFVLVDSRHGLKDVDSQIVKLLNDFAVPFRIILTKIDDTSEDNLNTQIESVTAFLKKSPAGFPEPFAVSARKKTNIKELQHLIRDNI
jgi:GTP-binding protein